MSNIYVEIYDELVKNNGIIDHENLNQLDKNKVISAYNFELLIRTYNNSKKCVVTKELSEFSIKEKSSKIIKGVYFDSKELTQIDLVNLSIEEKEDLIAAIIEALKNPQNKHAVCTEDNIYITKSKKNFSFLSAMLRLPIYNYKVLFKIHDESQSNQDWSTLLIKVFKENYSSFITKYGA